MYKAIILREATFEIKNDVERLFMKTLLPAYVKLIIAHPIKRVYVCELIHSHAKHDFNLRVQAIKTLREHLSGAHDLVAFACFAHMASLETEFDAQLFDVFLYYALVGIISPLPLKRVYSLNILNSIAQFNPESLIGSLDKIE